MSNPRGNSGFGMGISTGELRSCGNKFRRQTLWGDDYSDWLAEKRWCETRDERGIPTSELREGNEYSQKWTGGKGSVFSNVSSGDGLGISSLELKGVNDIPKRIFSACLGINVAILVLSLWSRVCVTISKTWRGVFRKHYDVQMSWAVQYIICSCIQSGSLYKMTFGLVTIFFCSFSCQNLQRTEENR